IDVPGMKQRRPSFRFIVGPRTRQCPAPFGAYLAEAEEGTVVERLAEREETGEVQAVLAGQFADRADTFERQVPAQRQALRPLFQGEDQRLPQAAGDDP